MTVADVFEQAKSLSPQERKELVKLLVDSLDIQPQVESDAPQEHWGKALNRLMEEIGPIELLYPEIEDPVEWVKHLRAERRKKRSGDWGQVE